MFGSFWLKLNLTDLIRTCTRVYRRISAGAYSSVLTTICVPYTAGKLDFYACNPKSKWKKRRSPTNHSLLWKMCFHPKWLRPRPVCQEVLFKKVLISCEKSKVMFCFFLHIEQMSAWYWEPWDTQNKAKSILLFSITVIHCLCIPLCKDICLNGGLHNRWAPVVNTNQNWLNIDTILVTTDTSTLEEQCYHHHHHHHQMKQQLATKVRFTV